MPDDLEDRTPRQVADVQPRITLDQVLWECFRHFAGMDESNAAVHVAQTRYSPITFRLAEQLAAVDPEWLAPWNLRLLQEVLRHLGAYEEDRGRDGAVLGRLGDPPADAFDLEGRG